MRPSPIQTELMQVDRPGERLDLFVVRKISGVSRTRAQSLIANGSVTVNDRPARPSTRLAVGQTIRITVPEPQEPRIEAQRILLDVIYENNDLVVVDKPAGLAVHPGPGHPGGTLANAVLSMCPGIDRVGDRDRPGIVHRLDKDTSGLIVVAKNGDAYELLSRQFRERVVQKGYLALVERLPDPLEAVIEAPIGRDPRSRKRMAVVVDGKQAVTRYRVKESFGSFSLIEVTPTTGRMHQIRVHMASIGHPLAGDRTYGKPHKGLQRHFLHAHRLAFRATCDGEYRRFKSDLPEDLRRFLGSLKGR